MPQPSSLKNPAAPRLIIFTRWPEPGRAKTRLIPALGKRGAAALQRQMTAKVAAAARRAAGSAGLALEVRHAGGEAREVAQWLGDDLLLAPQPEGDLGPAMHACLERALAQGAPAAALVGSDLPELSPEILLSAFSLLRRAPAVFGPAKDGGYYLAGLSRPLPQLFDPLPWGGPEVLARTLARAGRLGLCPPLLPPLGDLDLPGDLPRWQRAVGPLSLSVVIPALNEEQGIGRTIAAAWERGRPLEVIVADGGSQDRTLERARQAGARVLVSRPGRGGQMNAGAAAANGEGLLFLHADTLPPAGYHEEAARLLALPGISGGAYSFRLPRGGTGARLVEWSVDKRSRLGQLPYGDQALFTLAATFRQVGGYPEIPLMEDVELVKRLRRLGRLAISPLPALTSDRRWRAHGMAGATLRNWLTFAAYSLGVPPARLARWYYGKKPGQGL